MVLEPCCTGGCTTWAFAVGQGGGEDASGDEVPLDLGEPQFDLVEPGDLLRLLRRQVIGDHVDLFGRGLVDHDVCQEGDELRRSVPRRGFAYHLAGFSVERGV